MNERIRELFKRAGGKTSIHNLMSNPIQHREYNELWNDNIQKFAELIVEECVSICEKDGQWYTNTGWLAEAGEALSLSEQIKEHFGVK